MWESDDEDRFVAMYPALRRFAAVVRPPEVDADDLVQEALSRMLAVGALSSFDDPAAYLRRAIVNLASNHRRSYSRWRRAVARDRHIDDVANVYPSDLDDLVRLDPMDRAVLYLSIVDGHPYPDIARMVGISAVAVRARASRALRRLRVELRAEQREIFDA